MCDNIKNLPDQVEKLFEQQLSTWEQARNNFDALKNVEVKELDVDSMKIKVQFNPARMLSSGAKVDAKSIAARKCFLCGANRPDVQKGIPWKGVSGNEYTILINPFPIFPRHLTIPDNNHTLQLIKGRIADMIRLTSQLSDYTVFYNGPKCGASAPDHFHFQAGNSDFLTLAENMEKVSLEPLLTDPEGGAVLSVSLNSLPLNFFVIDATDADAAQKLLAKLYAAMPVPEGESEPMMNLLCYITEDETARLIIIPRKRHRPSFYGTEEGQMVLSPASVDMGGVFITPRPQDFQTLDPQLVGQTFSELCLNEDEINKIIEKL